MQTTSEQSGNDSPKVKEVKRLLRMREEAIEIKTLICFRHVIEQRITNWETPDIGTGLGGYSLQMGKRFAYEELLLDIDRAITDAQTRLGR